MLVLVDTPIWWLRRKNADLNSREQTPPFEKQRLAS
jgi:hypothetical protein